jgi:hypothetical protein
VSSSLAVYISDSPWSLICTTSVANRSPAFLFFGLRRLADRLVLNLPCLANLRALAFCAKGEKALQGAKVHSARVIVLGADPLGRRADV